MLKYNRYLIKYSAKIKSPKHLKHIISRLGITFSGEKTPYTCICQRKRYRETNCLPKRSPNINSATCILQVESLAE